MSKVNLEVKQADQLNDVALNNDQKHAVDLIIKRIKSGKKSFLLCGKGGTGKTTVLKAVVAELEKQHHFASIDIQAAAFTKAAVAVLRSRAGFKTAATIFKCLGKREEDWDAGELQFSAPDSRIGIFGKKLYIIDECSYIDGRLFTEINKSFAGSFVLWVGDHCQLHKPKAIGGSSPVFDTFFADPDSFFELKQIMRQKDSSRISELGELVRRLINAQDIDTVAATRTLFEKSPHVWTNGIDVKIEKRSEILSRFKSSVESPNYALSPIRGVFLGFSRKNIAAVEAALGNWFAVGRLVITDNYAADYKRRDVITGEYRTKDGELKHSRSKAAVDNNCKAIIQSIEPVVLLGCNFYKVELQTLTDALDTITLENIVVRGSLVEVLYPCDESAYKEWFRARRSKCLALKNSKPDNKNASITAETTRECVDIYHKNVSRGILFEDNTPCIIQGNDSEKSSTKTLYEVLFNDLVKSVCTLRNGYAMTVHKSQGSDYSRVILDLYDIKKALYLPDVSPDYTLRLLYVAITRARDILYIAV